MNLQRKPQNEKLQQRKPLLKIKQKNNIVVNGVDIESISRFEKYANPDDKGWLFLRRVFAGPEIDYCLSKAEPSRHLAARFCAKEALIKALSHYDIKWPDFNTIEIAHNEKGAPYFILPAQYDDLFISVSLSHCEDKAIAYVTIQLIE